MPKDQSLDIVIRAKDKASKTLKKLNRNVKNQTSVLNKRIGSVGKYSALAMGAAGAAAVKMAADFDESMRQVNVMADANQEEFEAMKKGVLDLSSKYATGAEEMSDAMYTVVSAGFRGKQSLEVLGVVAKGAAGGMADVAVTAEAVTKAMNIFGYEGREAIKIMDAFFGIVDQGLLSFEELASAFPRAATQAGVLGASLEETGAALAVVSKTAGSVEQGATAINSVFSAMTKPSEKLKQLFHDIGYESAQAAIKERGLAGVLEAVKKEAGGSADELAKLFKNKRALRAILPIVTTQSEDYAEALEALGNKAGNTNEAFEEMAAGPAFKMRQSMMKMKNATITLGGELYFLADALEFLTNAMVPTLKGIQALGPALGRIGSNIEEARLKAERLTSKAIPDWIRKNVALYETEEELNSRIAYQQGLQGGLTDQIVEVKKALMDYNDSNLTATERMKKSRKQVEEMEKALADAGDEAGETGDKMSDAMKRVFDSVKDVRKEIKGVYEDINQATKNYSERVKEIEKDKNEKIVDAAYEAESRIKELKNERQEAIARGDIKEARNYESQISRKQTVLDEFHQHHENLLSQLNEERRVNAMNEIERIRYMHEKKRKQAKITYLQEKVGHLERLIRLKKEEKVILDSVSKQKQATIKAEQEKTQTYKEELGKRSDKVETWMEEMTRKYKGYVNTINNILGEIGSGTAGTTPAFGGNPYGLKGQRQEGGYIPETGPYLLHEGEYVVPNNGGGVTVNVTGNQFLDRDAGEKFGNQLVDILKNQLDV